MLPTPTPGPSYRWNSAVLFGYAPASNTSPCHHSLHLSQDGVNYNMLVLLNNFWVGLLATVEAAELNILRAGQQVSYRILVARNGRSSAVDLALLN